MSAPLMVEVCRQCGHAAHPPRLLCPVCAARDWRPERAGAGLVEEVTLLVGAGEPEWRDERRVASVRLDRGPRVIARLTAGVGAGDRVLLETSEGETIAIGTGPR
jgi:uncharacterized OB-fold protein